MIGKTVFVNDSLYIGKKKLLPQTVEIIDEWSYEYPHLLRKRYLAMTEKGELVIIYNKGSRDWFGWSWLNFQPMES